MGAMLVAVLPATSLGRQAATKRTAVVYQGEQLGPEMLGPGRVETMADVMARERARIAGGVPTLAEADAPKHGVWAIPSPGAAEHPNSGSRYVANKHGATEMAISFDQPVDVQGAFLVGQGSAAVAAQCVRVFGYSGGEQVGVTDWMTLGASPEFFDFDLFAVDRIVFEAMPMIGGAAFYGLDDLTFVRAGELVILDFEDANYKQVLADDGYAGLTWETGSLGYRKLPEIVPAPQPGELPEPKGGVAGGGGATMRGGSGTPPTVLQGFEGVRRGDAGSASAPPDTHGAIGPNHYVVVVNRNIAIYARTDGTELSNILSTSFLPGSNGDPRVLYDQYADRWVVHIDDFSTTIYLAVSMTDDPTGAWFKTSINLAQGSDAGCFPDYPTLGVDADGYYVTAYMVGCGMSVFAIEKAPLIAPVPSLGTVTAWRAFPFEGAIQPVHTWGAAPGEYLISTRNTAQLAVRRIDGPLTAPTLTDLGSVDVATFSEPPDAPSMGAATPLDTVGSRLMAAMYRNARIYTAHAVNLSGRSGCRWYEVDAAGLSVVQTGDVDDPSLSFMFPTLAVNSVGDMVIGFSGSDSGTFGSAYVAGRVVADPAGQMSPPALLKAGQASHSIIDSFGRNRFGDYSQTSLDPTDELKFWTAQEWVQGVDTWSTWVAELETTEPPLLVQLTSAVPELIAPGTSLTVDADITAAAENIQAGSQTLFYRYDGGAYLGVPLVNVGGSAYQGTLPAVDCGDAPEFYVSAQGDGGSTVTDPASAPAAVFATMVGTATTIFNDNFETDMGWTTENLGATTGDWERGVPVNDPGWDYDPAADSDGSGQCYLTMNQFGNTDIDNGEVRLISPTIDMTAGGITIRYDYFLNLTVADGVDWLKVDISSNGDAGPWTNVATHDTSGGLAWRSSTITSADLSSALVTLTSNMKLRFRASDDATNSSINESAIDAVRVESIGCAPVNPCPGDVDGDGIVNITDLGIVLQNFGQSGPGIPGDVDSDDDVDITDLGILLANFGNNCN
jgi:hypothetical protein